MLEENQVEAQKRAKRDSIMQAGEESCYQLNTKDTRSFSASPGRSNAVR